MTESSLLIRPFQEGDEEALVSLWNICKLTVPWNNPYKDIARKLRAIFGGIPGIQVNFIRYGWL